MLVGHSLNYFYMGVAAVISAEEQDTIIGLSAQSHSTGALWQRHWDSFPWFIWRKNEHKQTTVRIQYQLKLKRFPNVFCSYL